MTARIMDGTTTVSTTGTQPRTRMRTRAAHGQMPGRSALLGGDVPEVAERAAGPRVREMVVGAR